MWIALQWEKTKGSLEMITIFQKEEIVRLRGRNKTIQQLGGNKEVDIN